jgi:PAS domain S-box-containing protein
MDLSKLYRDIVETSPDGIWVIDLQGRTVYANSTLAELLGRDTTELADLTVFDALDDVGRVQFADHLQELQRGRIHEAEVECLWVRRDGSRLWVLLRESPLYDGEGHLSGYLHRVTDYSDRRRLFEELSASRALLAEAQRIAKVGSYDWDVVEDRIETSDELHAMYGIPREDFAGDLAAFLDLVDESDRAAVLDAVASALAGTDVLDITIRVRRGDGTAMWVRSRGELVRDEEGRPRCLHGTQQDVTDGKEAEDALQDMAAQNALMQAVATAANEAETLIQVLEVARGLLLHHDDWVRGRAFLPEGERSGHLAVLQLDREEREADETRPEVLSYELGLAAEAHRRCEQVWDQDTHPDAPSIAFPVRLGDEVVAVIVITMRTPVERHAMTRGMVDQVAVQLARVAERERAARELAAARDAAMEGSRQKSEFLATMSHEIRTPLNGVIGLNDLLLRTELDAHQRRLASGAKVASRALLTVVNDILDFSKIEAGRLELEAVDFEVRKVFDQVANVLAESARSKGLELLVSCHPDVPELLNGDPTRLAQVLTNLGSNAVKFTAEGEVCIRASSVPHRDGTLLRVEVSDTGIGVDAGQRDRIFDAFSQADASTTRQYGGTGLGLAISREIVSALGGEIAVQSGPGRGATFWFTARFTPAGGSQTPDPQPREARLEGRRVLVVDDNAHNRLIITEHLDRWRMRSDAVTGALEAVERMRAAVQVGDPYAVVLLDMAMPRHDGLDLARMVAADPRIDGVPLVMLTSTPEIDRSLLAEAGIVACLTKPVLAGEVRDVLMEVLAGEPVGSRTPAAPGTVAARGRPLEERARLLVVEDNPVNQLVALGILETLGYEADTADDGVEALERLGAGCYAAVLMDVQMPRLDGYATTRALRESESEAGGRRTPVVAMTAAAVEGERDRCLAAGMDDFLTKPIDPEALGSALRRWVDRSTGTGPTDPHQVAGTAQSALDRDRLDMLRELDPSHTTYLDNAIGNFVARVPEAVDALRTAISARDHAALTQAAHRTKGSALNLGLSSVGHLAHELEMLGDSGSTAGAPALLAELEEALAQAVAAIRSYQRSYSGEPGPAGCPAH